MRLHTKLSSLDNVKKMLHALGIKIKPIIDFEKGKGINGKSEQEIEKQLKEKYK